MKVACVVLSDFEVAVELARYPDLAGKPVVVGGLPHERKTVRGLSPEAAASGVAEGMPLREAEGLCPEAVFLPADDALYRETLARVLATLDAFSPRVEMSGGVGGWESRRRGDGGTGRRGDGGTRGSAPRSSLIAHHSSLPQVLVYLDASGLEMLFGPDGELGERIAVAVEMRARLQARVGIGSGKFVAQMAALAAAPGSFLVVRPGEERAFLAPLPVERIPCSGEMRRRLDLFGLRTMGQLASLPRGALGEQFGKEGLEAALLARGIDERPVISRDPPAVLEEEAEIDPPTEDSQILMGAARQLARRLERQMRSSFVACQEVVLDLGFEDGSDLRLSTALHEPTDNAEDLLRTAERLLSLPPSLSPTPPLISLLRLSLSGFGNTRGEQLELLPTRAGSIKKVQRAVSQAEELFGEGSIHSLNETGRGRLPASRIGVIVDPGGWPDVLLIGGRKEKVREIANRWRAQEEWWRREVLREYYRIITEAGRLCLIYQDLLGGGWFLERIYG